jgi:Flp pilus assembly protein TadD
MQIVKNRILFFTLPVILALGVSLGGCGYLKERDARANFNQYQQALASGDLRAARKALLKVVRVQQDVPDYWMALGRLQLQLGSYRGAYNAYAHAHELDRTNVEALAAMAQLALTSGEAELATEHARDLALLAPANPMVAVVHAYTDLQSGNLDKAETGLNGVLANAPNDSFATRLKARVLLAKTEFDDAIALLEQQHRAVPEDKGTTQNLAAMYKVRDDWRNVARIQYDAHKLEPKNLKISHDTVEAFLRAGNVAAAAKLSAPLVQPNSNSQLVEDVLGLWADYAPRGTDALDPKLGQAMSGERRVSFANYYNRIGKPAAAAALLSGSKLPVTHDNARWNAVFAQALALQGRGTDAKRLFDQVLDREADQADALRGRSALEAKTGNTRQAIIDAQRLVTVEPNSGEDRLLLAQAFLAAGNRDEVKRTLWQAFQDLPDDESVFSALKSVLGSNKDVDGQRRLEGEYMDRRMARLQKDMV